MLGYLIAVSVHQNYAIKVSFLLQSNIPISEDASFCWMHNSHYKVNTEESYYFFIRDLKDFRQLDMNWWRRCMWPLKKGEKKRSWQLYKLILCTLCLGEEFCRVFSRLIIIAGNIRPLFYLQLPFTAFPRDIGAINLASNISKLDRQIPIMTQTDNHQTK